MGGCFMNLTQLETNFRSRFEDLKLSVNQADPWRVATEGALKAKAMNFKAAMDHFEAEKNSIISDLQTWKASRLKLQKNDLSKDPHDLSEVNRKNKLRRTFMKILNFIGGIFCGTGFTSMMGAHFFLRLHVITAAAAMGPTFGGLAILAVGGIMLGVSALMKNSKLSREIRLCNSENFKDFLRNVVKITSDEKSWHQPEQDLLNPNLHKIYERYKTAVIGLPRS